MDHAPARPLARNARLDIRPLCGALGAEVVGLDLADDMDEDTFAEVRQAFLDHVVLLFRGQSLTPAQHVAFTRRFGAVEEHPLRSRKGVEHHPEILVLENRPGQPGARNDFWHSDISFAERPPLGSVLYAKTIPDGGRGDTMFCNMYAAWEALSPGMQRLLGERRALHTAAAIQRRNNEAKSDGQTIQSIPEPVAHPIARTHPDSGRKALFVNPYFTERLEHLTAEESRPILEPLYRQATRPENVYRHRWQAGDVLMWDNRCAMHYAVADYDDTMPRLMHRTTAAGDRPA